MTAPPLNELLARALNAERQAAHWRGFVFGFIAGAVCVTLLLLSALAVAQTVPRQAYELRRDLFNAGRLAWGLDAPTAALAAQVHQESAWRIDVRSRVGAQGLTQFMPATATWISSAYRELGPADPYNPRWALRAQSIYMRHIFDRVAGVDFCERFAFALTGYNGGLGWVNKRKQMSEFPLICFGATCNINPGIASYNQKENSEYPVRILLRLEPVYERSGFGTGACP